MTDDALIVVGVLIWATFFFRYWRVANHVDRYEGMILRPLSISVDALGLHYLLHGEWWAAAIALFWGIFWIGGVVGGATLRADRSSQELTHPPKPVAGGEFPELSHDESFLLAKAVGKLSLMGFLPEMLLCFHHGLKWYIAAPVSIGISVIIGPVLALLSFGVAALTLKKQQPQSQ
ncbi:MAG: hypothetical protein WB992_09370 [Bryobacteraceae bacterium]